MKRICLIHVYAPQNVLPAVCALRHYGKYLETPANEVIVVLHNPGWEMDKLSESLKIIEKQIRSQGWADIVVIPESKMQQEILAGQSYKDEAAQSRFRSVLGKDINEISEVYYSHDVMPNAAQLCMRAYPEALRITYGESMGLMEDSDYLLASVLGTGWDESKAHLRPKSSSPKATIAILILPVDQTGDCLKDMDLLVVPHSLVTEVVSDFQKSMPELGEYTNSLLAENNSPYFLFPVNNIADANFISADREVAMYEEMIRAQLPKGSTVIVKGHPLAVLPIDRMLASRLEDDYKTAVIDARFSRYPLELWQDLLSVCQLLSLSYTSISIEYIYRKPVIYCIDSEIILKYIDEKVFNRFKDADELFRKQREALKYWDGKGIICSGKRISFPPAKAKLLEPYKDLSKAESLNQQGIAVFQGGQIEEALKLFLKALDAGPQHSGVMNNIATSLWQLGRAQEAVVYFSIAQAANPEDKGLLLILVQALTHLGSREAAKAVCYRFLEKNPEDKEALELFSKI